MSSARGNAHLRRFDRYAGIPLLAPLALLPKRSMPASPSVRRIGILKTAAIGDTVLLAGLTEDLQRTFPKATLTLIAGADNVAAADLVGGFQECVIVSPHAPASAIRSVRASRLDVLLDFGSWPRFDAMLAAFSGARFRVGFRTPGQHRHFAFDRCVDHSREVHERENYARLVAAVGVEARTPARLRSPGLLRPDQLPSAPYAVLHAGAGGYLHELKEWPVDRWRSVGNALAARGFNIVLSGGPGEQQRSSTLAEALEQDGCTTINAAGAFTILELADVLVCAEIVVSVNTGIMHMAGLLGARTVGLHGPTSPARWGPLGPRVRAVTSTLGGCPYLNLGFEYAGNRPDCMDGISVDMVLAAIDELLPS